MLVSWYKLLLLGVITDIQIIINQFQLEKYFKEKEDDKKALVETHIIKKSSGKYTLKVYNKGKALAENVVIEIPDLMGLHIMSNPSPIDIRPQNGVSIELIISTGAPDTMDVSISWKDKFSSNNKYSEKITF